MSSASKSQLKEWAERGRLAAFLLLLASCRDKEQEAKLSYCESREIELNRRVATLQAKVDSESTRADSCERDAKQVAAKLDTCTVAKEELTPHPVADALAALLRPKAKHLEKEKSEDHDMWNVDANAVPGAIAVTLLRLKENPNSWSFHMNGKLHPEDFGRVEHLCGKKPAYYKIVSGSLAGAFIEDQLQEQFLLRDSAFNKDNHWFPWKCGTKILGE